MGAAVHRFRMYACFGKFSCIIIDDNSCYQAVLAAVSIIINQKCCLLAKYPNSACYVSPAALWR